MENGAQVHLAKVVVAQAGRARHVDVYRYRQLLRVCLSGENARMIGLADARTLGRAASDATDLLTQVCAALLRQGLLGEQDEQGAPRVLN